MRAAKAGWCRLTPGDLARIENKQDLITTVEELQYLAHQSGAECRALGRSRSGMNTPSPRYLAPDGSSDGSG